MTDLFGDIPVSAPIYGDESDGEVIESADTTRGATSLAATRYVVEPGVNVNMTGPLLVAATEEIVVNGTIDASGAGASGGGGGGTNSDGGTGGNGQFVPLGSGGEGGNISGGNGQGGAGGNGDQTGPLTRRDLIRITSAVLTDLNDGPAGAGGGGGGGGAQVDSGGSSGDGSAPGGGGAGGVSETFGGIGSGGTGGDGGGAVYLIAPTVRGTGVITCDGQDGSQGQDGDAPGGGGGGGSGGLNAIFAETNRFTGTQTAAAGSGGAPGNFTGDPSFDTEGSPGADGADGLVLNVTSN